MLQVLVAVTGGASESVALVLNEEVPPAAVAIPVIAPVEEFRVRPAGSDPGATKKV